MAAAEPLRAGGAAHDHGARRSRVRAPCPTWRPPGRTHRGPEPETGLPAVAVPDPPTPLLTVDTQIVRRLHGALRSALPGVELHYAVKANPSSAVLATLAAQGARWDVASPGEIERPSTSDPDPSAPLLRQHRQEGRGHRVRHRPWRAPVLLRQRRRAGQAHGHAPGATLMVRLATSGSGADWALGRKFGCTEARGGSPARSSRALGHPVGVCFHVGSQQRDVHAWDEPLAATARLRAGLRRYGVDLALVDLGGGFPAHGRGPDAPHRRLRAGHPRLGAPAPRPHPAAADGRAGSLPGRRRRRPRDRGRPRRRARWHALGPPRRRPVLGAGRDDGRGPALPGLRAPQGPPARGPRGGGGPRRTDVRQRRRAVRAAPSSAPADLRPGDRVRLHGTGAYTTTYSSVGFNGFAPLRERSL